VRSALRRGEPAHDLTGVAVRECAPETRSFGGALDLLAEKRGDGVDALIARIGRVGANSGAAPSSAP
jgi:hypothetical protein